MNLVMAGGTPYRVPPEPNRGPALLLAGLVHAALLGALWIGVNWQNSAPVSVEAEVWDIKTESAAAPPPEAPEPEPEPPAPQPKVEQPVETPKPPDIALERKKKEELKKKELEEKKLAEKKAREEADKKAKKLAAEKAALEKQRQEELKRMLGATGVSGTAQKSTAPKSDSGYIARLTAKIYPNIIFTGNKDVPGDPKATYRIEQLPTGEVMSVRMVKSSGLPEWDRAVESAIKASSPLPKNTDGTVVRSLEVDFRLKKD